MTEIYPYNTKKARVKLENGVTFALYRGELRKYKIKENVEISVSIYEEIMEHVLLKRAKERALYMLKDSSKTKRQVSDKLSRAYYPDEIISNVIAFLEKYGYINDFDYALNYIEQNVARKSIQRIKSDLFQKGISKDILEDAMSQSDLNEEASITKLIHSKMHRYNLDDFKDRRKLYALLQRNGYCHETIMNAFQKL